MTPHASDEGANFPRTYAGAAGAQARRIDGTADDDRLAGDEHANRIRGLGGDDIIEGGNGADTLIGGDGADLLAGSAIGWAGAADEADLLNGGAGDDSLFGSDGGDSLIGGAGNDMMFGGVGFVIMGTPHPDGDDVADCGLGDDSAWGDGGDDTLMGGAGDDLLVGQAGSDLISGGAGIDTAGISFRDAGPTRYRGEGFRPGDSVLDDGRGGLETLTGVERLMIEGSQYSDTLTGSGFDDSLNGRLGRDVLKGGDGNDTLNGSIDADTLEGGAGSDIFLFDKFYGYGDRRTDRIRDLTDEDWIDLSGTDADVFEPGVQPFHRVDSFTGADGEFMLVYDAARDRTLLLLGSADNRAAVMAGDHSGFDNFVL